MTERHLSAPEFLHGEWKRESENEVKVPRNRTGNQDPPYFGLFEGAIWTQNSAVGPLDVGEHMKKLKK